MNTMISLVMLTVALSAVAANENPKVAIPVEKRQVSSYISGAVQPAPIPQPTPAANNAPAAASYQPNYLPVCVVQPPYYNGPSESYVPQYQPQYQPQYYPAAAYPAPPQYPFAYQPAQQYPATYQPAQQYPAAYQPSQYPVAYQPQQQSPAAVAPYSYSYFTSTAGNNANNANNNNNVPLSNKK